MNRNSHINPIFVQSEEMEDETGNQREVATTKKNLTSRREILYGIDETPPWFLCLLLGLQHYFIMVGSTITIPYFLTPLLCIEDSDPARGQIISSILFVSGIVTMLQTTVGCRLPIVQGGTFAFLLPTIAILSTSFPSCDSYELANMTRIEKDEIWMSRVREIQGAIIVASVFQVIVGFTGFVGYILSWISPLTIVPTVTLVGMALFRPATEKAASHWGISSLTAALLILFSQYLTEVGIPVPKVSHRKITWKSAKIFKFFPIMFAILISWSICAILTAVQFFPSDSQARTDTQLTLIEESPWFYVPYPFQWGLPTFSLSGIIGMLAGVLASMAESIGDYYACARLSEAGIPPQHAVNRGIGIEGIGCIIAGIIGTGNGTTSYSDNIGAIRMTRVASRRVIQVAAILMLICGMFGKVAAIFVSIPNPVVGGVFIVMFGVITAIGLSNLQVVDLNSSRNLFILGFSLFTGLAIPEWIGSNKGAIQTGSSLVDQVLTVLLSTSMFVGGFLGLVLDNTIPGTDEERGLTNWTIQPSQSENEKQNDSSCYDLPFGKELFQRVPWCSKVPVSPTFQVMRNPAKNSLFQKLKNLLVKKKEINVCT